MQLNIKFHKIMWISFTSITLCHLYKTNRALKKVKLCSGNNRSFKFMNKPILNILQNCTAFQILIYIYDNN